MGDQTSEQRICPLEHRAHPDRPSLSAPGSVLCRGHISKVLDRLQSLATFAQDAERAAHDQALSRHVGAPVSGDPEKSLPFDARTAEHKLDVGQVLVSWVKLVAEERDVSAPDLVGVAENRVPAALCAFLRKHHDWSVSQPWADDYAGEILELGRRAWSLLHPSGRRQFKVGRCVEVVGVTGTGPGNNLLDVLCDGTVWALLTPADPVYDAANELVCDTCGHRVPATEWLTYGRRVKASAA